MSGAEAWAARARATGQASPLEKVNCDAISLLAATTWRLGG